jgi:uncharacterized protein YjdB
MKKKWSTSIRKVLTAGIAFSFVFANSMSIHAAGATDSSLVKTNQLTVTSESINAFLEKGSLGFFQYNASKGDTSYGEQTLNKGIELATALAKTGSYTYGSETYTIDSNIVTNVKNKDDAASIYNLAKTFKFLKECNQMRTTDNNFTGLSPLKVTDSMMASAETNANFATEAIGHWVGNGSMLEYIGSGEDLAWGYSDPFSGWYTEEKYAYDHNTGNETGHYTAIVSSGFSIAGFSMRNCKGFYGSSAALDFERTGAKYMGTEYSVEDYEARFAEYCKANGVNYDSSTGKLLIPVTDVTLDQSSMTVFTNTSKTLNATVGPDDAADKTLTWTSSNGAVASVDASGKVSGGTPGTAVITATATSGVSASCTVEVKIGILEMYRLYNPNSGEHFYTNGTDERDYLASIGWNYEGVGWNAPSSSNTPVFRMYNANGGEHHYTTSADERDYLVTMGWSFEGIGWYSDDNQEVPLYRQYNPNQFACNHNYTTSEEENNILIDAGWQYEGIGWYGCN